MPGRSVRDNIFRRTPADTSPRRAFPQHAATADPPGSSRPPAGTPAFHTAKLLTRRIRIVEIDGAKHSAARFELGIGHRRADVDLRGEVDQRKTAPNRFTVAEFRCQGALPHPGTGTPATSSGRSATTRANCGPNPQAASGVSMRDR